MKFKPFALKEIKYMSKVYLVLVSLLILIVMPVAILAQEEVPEEITECDMRHDLTGTDWQNAGFTCPAKNASCPFNSTTYTCGICCVLDTIYTVTDWAFIIVTSIAILMIIVGAFYIITAGGAPDRVSTGRNYILYAVIGIIVGLMFKAIPSIARAILGA